MYIVAMYLPPCASIAEVIMVESIETIRDISSSIFMYGHFSPIGTCSPFNYAIPFFC